MQPAARPCIDSPRAPLYCHPMQTRELPGTIMSGVKTAIPIVIGFIPVAVTFGLLAKNTGLLLGEAAGMSLIVFAGASQFMAINLLAEGVLFVEIVIATFLLNLRHILMSASLAPKTAEIRPGFMKVLAFWVTDESFAVLSSLPGKLSGRFMFGLQIATYIAWSTGTVIGYIVGAALPESLQNAMGIALYALFTALLVGRIKKRKPLVFLALLSAGLNMLFVIAFNIPIGWSFVLAMIISAVFGTLTGFEVNGEGRNA